MLRNSDAGNKPSVMNLLIYSTSPNWPTTVNAEPVTNFSSRVMAATAFKYSASEGIV